MGKLSWSSISSRSNRAIRLSCLFLGSFPLGAAEVTVQPPHPISASGLTEKVTLTVEEGGSAVPAVDTTLVVAWPDGSTTTLHEKTGPDGKALYPIAIQPEMAAGEAGFRFQSSSPKLDTVAKLDILDRENYQELDRLAASIPLKKPLRILYLGDSLTAQYAGTNHADKVQFWLNRHHPGQVTFRNAAVGGDSIRTVWRRFQHLLDPAKKAQHSQETYHTLFDFKPDVIFILLGQNDTKASNASGFKEPHIGFAVQEESFRSVIHLLKKKTDAQVVLLSSVSPVEEICRRRAQSRTAAGDAVYLMHGIPELMQQYNEQVRRLSREYSLDYLEIYTPIKDHPDKASLFNPVDGVHLTAEGHRFLTMLLLQYLAGPNQVFGPAAAP